MVNVFSGLLIFHETRCIDEWIIKRDNNVYICCTNIKTDKMSICVWMCAHLITV
jgi:ribosomal protein L36